MHHELENIPHAVRTALTHARQLAVTSCTSVLKPEALLARIPSEFAALKAEGPHTRNCDGNLAYLQALFFMAIVTENSGTVYSRNTSWIAEAVSIATHLNLHQSYSFDIEDATDEDAPAKVARRVWLSLVVLDRFHASSTASPLLVAEDTVRLVALDEAILGHDAYHLVRKFKMAAVTRPCYNSGNKFAGISLVLGHISNAMLYLDSERNHSHPRELLLDTVLKGEVDRLGECLHHIFPPMPHVNLAFAHLKLLSLRLPSSLGSTASERLDLADLNADQLSSPTSIIRPLIHHFAGLAAIILAEDVSDAQSVTSLRRLQAVLDTGYIQDNIESSKSAPHKTLWNAPISSFISKKLRSGSSGSANERGSSRGGLQHLADAAVGNGSNGMAADWTAVGVKGFLTEFE